MEVTMLIFHKERKMIWDNYLPMAMSPDS